MANWAKLQEDLVGLPVAKRAKHGIHFQKGANEFVANFSGKPCHYEDAGLWKPIDTKLVLLPDGFYGCPHSPVRVHSDGRMAVAGTDYAQRVELPSAKTGLADGDKLVREFSFGKQELRITEVGFKSEITLNRIPTLTEARKLIASESGTLSKKYLKSLTTATDANDNTHTITTLSAFRTWLAKAVFPVVIDPDFSLGNTNYGDTYLNHDSTRNTYNYGNAVTLTISTINCAIMRFDLTSIASGATCTEATLKLYRSKKSADSRTGYYRTFSISAANSDWVEGTGNGTAANSGEPCWNARKADGSGGVTDAWAGSVGCATSGTDYEATELGDSNAVAGNADLGTELSTSLTTTRVGNWFGTPNTNYGIRIIGMDVVVNTTLGSSENATESYRPVLTVTYSAGGTTGNPLMHRWRRI